MERSARPSKRMWLVPVVFLFFLVLALITGAMLQALAWLCLLVEEVLLASGLSTRTRALSYPSLAFVLLGLALLATSLVRHFFQ